MDSARAHLRPDDNVVYSPSFFRDSERLLLALKQGQPGARAVFFAIHADHIERLLRRILGPEEGVQAMLSKVFVKALLELRRRRDAGPSDLDLWLERLAVGQALSRLRWRRLRGLLPFGRWALARQSARNMVDWESNTDERESMAIVRQMDAVELRNLYEMIHLLPALQATALCLYWAAGYETARVAELCDLPFARAARLLESGERTVSRRARQLGAVRKAS